MLKLYIISKELKNFFKVIIPWNVLMSKLRGKKAIISQKYINISLCILSRNIIKILIIIVCPKAYCFGELDNCILFTYFISEPI